MLDIRKLNMLAELDRLGTIAAVSRSLRLTAPGISMQLAALEREIGVQLTERQGRRIVLTPAGRLLAHHGSSIVDMLTVAEMEVASIRDGAVGTYRVAAFPTAAAAILPAAWKSINSTRDLGLELRLLEMEPSISLPALAAGEIELAVVHQYSNMPPLTGPGLSITPIATETVRLAVPVRQWSGSSARADLSDFAAHEWIVPNREWTCYDMVHRATDLAGFEPRTVAEATDFRVQLALVAAGVGVALIPQLGTLDVPAGVVLLDLTEPVFRHIVLATRRASASDPGLKRIAAAITASATIGLAAGAVAAD
jgi:DNA-binding transcriptional LysR family regulator